ncbi:MAG: BatA domain-containing protein [Vicinamibacterales bacterium]
MTFLTPLFLLGLAAVAVPVLIHLTQRQRNEVVAFPSLMFVRRIPYESVKRRRIRDWLLLALRAAALALIVAAFARPFVRGSQLSAAAGGAREVVLLMDRSYSMGAGDTWARAQAAARQALGTLGPLDRVSLVFFASNAEMVLRSSAAASTGRSAWWSRPASRIAETRLPRCPSHSRSTDVPCSPNACRRPRRARPRSASRP